MQVIHIIYNDKSGYGQSQTYIQQLSRKFKEVEMTVHLYSILNDLSQLAEKIQTNDDKNQSILLIGGDGSLHHLLNYLYQQELTIPIAIIPTGTGNDFSKTWQKSFTLDRFISKCMNGNLSYNEVPMVHWHNHQTNEDGVLINSMGIGLDAIVNYNAHQLVNKLPGKLYKIIKSLNLVYLIGLFASLNQIPRFEIELTTDQEIYTLEEVSVATLVNNPFFGGGIMIDNLTRPDSRRLSFIAFHHLTLLSVFELLMKVLIFRNQHTCSKVQRFEADSMRIRTKQNLIGQMDGESFQGKIDFSFTMQSHPFLLDK